MNENPVGQLREALDAVDGIVAGIRGDHWDARTPCTEWTVRQLVNHLVAGNRLVAAVLAGAAPPPLAELRSRQAVDQLGADPVAAYRESADAVVEGFAAPGRLERPVEMPVGTVPGMVGLHLRVVETLVHGWDLARATGQPHRLPEDLAEQELAFTIANLPRVPAGRSPFAEPQPVADDAPAVERLVARLGRPVS